MFAGLKGWGLPTSPINRGCVVGWLVCWFVGSEALSVYLILNGLPGIFFGSSNNQKRNVLEGFDSIRLELCICSPSSANRTREKGELAAKS